jgi:uncharacterized protein (DUF952 family)
MPAAPVRDSHHTSMTVIYHITTRRDWNQAMAVGAYTPDSLAAEGFIHCSTARQVIATANRLFAGRSGLVLLCVETDRVTAEIRHENLEGGTTLFPHVYGVLQLASVCAVHDFPSQNDGTFDLPATLKSAPWIQETSD